MMPCTRPYVDPTEVMMGQAREKKIISLLKQRQENIKNYNSFVIIITSKDSKKSFKNS